MGEWYKNNYKFVETMSFFPNCVGTMTMYFTYKEVIHEKLVPVSNIYVNGEYNGGMKTIKVYLLVCLTEEEDFSLLQLHYSEHPY